MTQATEDGKIASTVSGSRACPELLRPWPRETADSMDSFVNPAVFALFMAESNRGLKDGLGPYTIVNCMSCCSPHAIGYRERLEALMISLAMIVRCFAFAASAFPLSVKKKRSQHVYEAHEVTPKDSKQYVDTGVYIPCLILDHLLWPDSETAPLRNDRNCIRLTETRDGRRSRSFRYACAPMRRIYLLISAAFAFSHSGEAPDYKRKVRRHQQACDS